MLGKECEFRFNYGSPKQLLTTIKNGLKSIKNNDKIKIIYASP